MNQDNTELHLADEYANFTDCMIFLTGRAGTGKTTFLQTLKKNSPKRLIVVAPTGVAAINAGGVTMHSFFQLPFGPYVPGTEQYQQNRHFKFNKEKINIIKSLELLIIDEISMVRADMLDAIDTVLRKYRRNTRPFGGVQLLMIGDLQQLPPVVTNHDKPIINAHYKTPYFFSSHALQKCELAYLELQKIYRQSDTDFIDLLNTIRDNTISQAELNQLNQKYQPEVLKNVPEGTIILCTHNNKVESINEQKLSSIKGRSHYFTARIEDEFPEQAYPTPLTLELKIGAQVMFIKNDHTPEKRFFNGKIGRVMDISSATITVNCEDNEVIEVDRVVWENIDYTLNEKSGEIDEKTLGTFSQFPLKLAWAITIHKSQGLTFDRAIIDGEAAFAAGQIYVALSRCRSLDGIILGSKLRIQSLSTEHAVTTYIKNARARFNPYKELEKQKILYQQQLLNDCFDFLQLKKYLTIFITVLGKNAHLIQLTGVGNLEDLSQQVEQQICTVGANFQIQLAEMRQKNLLPSENKAINERCIKAQKYFEEKLQSLLFKTLKTFTFEADNKEIKKEINKAYKNLFDETHVKIAGVNSCMQGFSPIKYLRSSSEAERSCNGIKQKISGKQLKQSVSYSEEDIAHPELFQQLKDWRQDTAKKSKLVPFQVLHQKVLVQLAVTLPDTVKKLQTVKGVGPRKVEQYSEELLKIITLYRQKKNITRVELSETAALKKEKASSHRDNEMVKTNTKEQTLQLFHQGLTIEAIAKERNLTQATIETHLAHWIEQGKIDIGHFQLGQLQQEIEDELQKEKNPKYSMTRENLGNRCSYGQIKLVQAHLRHKARE